MDKATIRKKAEELAALARKKTLEDANTYMDRYVSCWNDLYGFFFREIEGYRNNKGERTADYTIGLFSSFVHALRDLPDEGDVVVIGKRTMHILVNQQDRTGFDPFGYSEESIENTAGLIQALGQLVEVSKAQEETPTEKPQNTDILH
jgi:hypothetical protein